MKSFFYTLALCFLLSASSTVALATTANELIREEVSTNPVIIENLQAGELEAAIRNKGLQPQDVVSLTISGNINGTDLRLLRVMAGSDENGAPMTTSKLTTLNLAETNIVKGGLFYVMDNKKVEYYTVNDELGMYAFFQCQSLRSFTFPNSLKTLRSAAFSFCKKLVEVIFSPTSKLTTIPQSAFYGDINLGYDSILNIEKPLILPDGITEIGNSAFYKCQNLRVDRLPASIKSIEDMAFMECYNLRIDELPASIKSIGDVAFQDCYNLRIDELPASIESIGDGAFTRCRGISNIDIPASLTAIGDAAFACMDKVTAFNVANGNPNYSSASGVLYNKDYTVLYNYPCAATLVDEFRIPSSVTEIGSMAFYAGNSIKKLVIPASVVTINEMAYTYNRAVEEIEFAADSPIEDIGTMDFCFKLKKVTLPTALQTINMSAFEMCLNLRECNIPSGLTEIGDMAFTWTKLEKIHIPKSLTGIGARAFFNCSALSEITVEGGNEYFVAENNVLYDAEKTALLLYPSGITASSYSVNPGIVEIAEGAFSSNRYLKEVTIPAATSQLGTATFFACSSIEKLTLPNNLTMVPAFMCAGNSSMQSANIPSSVETIGKAAFALTDVSATTDLWMGQLVSSMADQIKEELLTILEELSNQNIVQPNPLKPTLGKRIIFPMSLESVGTSAFLGAKIEELETLNPTPIVLESDGHDKTTFDLNAVEKATLFVPIGSVSTYTEADQWGWFGSILESSTSSLNRVEEVEGTIVGTKGGFRVTSLAVEGSELRIYSASGMLHQLIKVRSNDFIPADKGVYIVHLGGQVHKEIVY